MGRWMGGRTDRWLLGTQYVSTSQTLHTKWSSLIELIQEIRSTGLPSADSHPPTPPHGGFFSSDNSPRPANQVSPPHVTTVTAAFGTAGVMASPDQGSLNRGQVGRGCHWFPPLPSCSQ